VAVSEDFYIWKNLNDFKAYVVVVLSLKISNICIKALVLTMSHLKLFQKRNVVVVKSLHKARSAALHPHH